jgi:hypothetical protein
MVLKLTFTRGSHVAAGIPTYHFDLISVAFVKVYLATLADLPFTAKTPQ